MFEKLRFGVTRRQALNEFQWLLRQVESHFEAPIPDDKKLSDSNAEIIRQAYPVLVSKLKEYNFGNPEDIIYEMATLSSGRFPEHPLFFQMGNIYRALVHGNSIESPAEMAIAGMAMRLERKALEAQRAQLLKDEDTQPSVEASFIDAVDRAWGLYSLISDRCTKDQVASKFGRFLQEKHSDLFDFVGGDKNILLNAIERVVMDPIVRGKAEISQSKLFSMARDQIALMQREAKLQEIASRPAPRLEIRESQDEITAATMRYSALMDKCWKEAKQLMGETREISGLYSHPARAIAEYVSKLNDSLQSKILSGMDPEVQGLVLAFTEQAYLEQRRAVESAQRAAEIEARRNGQSITPLERKPISTSEPGIDIASFGIQRSPFPSASKPIVAAVGVAARDILEMDPGDIDGLRAYVEFLKRAGLGVIEDIYADNSNFLSVQQVRQAEVMSAIIEVITVRHPEAIEFLAVYSDARDILERVIEIAIDAVFGGNPLFGDETRSPQQNMRTFMSVLIPTIVKELEDLKYAVSQGMQVALYLVQRTAKLATE